MIRAVLRWTVTIVGERVRETAYDAMVKGAGEHGTQMPQSKSPMCELRRRIRSSHSDW
jgi:hypothetical protein